MLTCSIAILLLVLQNSSGLTIRGSELVPDRCDGQGTQFMLYRVHRAFLEEHNSRRALLAKGEVEIEGTPLPAAANMRFMAYNCGLEKEATKLTTTCKELPSETHFNQTKTNFAKIPSSLKNGPVTVAEEAVSRWWSKKSLWNSPMKITKADESAIPFFLIAQAETDKFGCSITYCPNGDDSYYTVACIYEKAVEADKDLYQNGTACSSCTNNCFKEVLCKKP